MYYKYNTGISYSVGLNFAP